MRRSPLRSPPRMRGKAKNRCRSCPLTRITPACAGKRTCTATRRCGNGNHPRVCGEKFTVRFTRMVLPGSPPRMRGKDGVNDSAQAVTGITPAYAGKRTLVGECPKPLWDHPRVCGEKNNTAKTYSNMEGSPPRMRGKGQAACEVVVEFWITPACAGKSCSSSVSSSQRMSWTIRSRI